MLEIVSNSLTLILSSMKSKDKKRSKILLLRLMRSRNKFKKNIKKREGEKESIKEKYFITIVPIQSGLHGRFIQLCPTIKDLESLKMPFQKKI